MIDGAPCFLKVLSNILLENFALAEIYGKIGRFAAKIGPDEFSSVLVKYGGEEALEEWTKIMNRLIGPDSLSEAAQATPSLALREDAFALISLSRLAFLLIAILNFLSAVQIVISVD